MFVSTLKYYWQTHKARLMGVTKFVRTDIGQGQGDLYKMDIDWYWMNGPAMLITYNGNKIFCNYKRTFDKKKSE